MRSQVTPNPMPQPKYVSETWMVTKIGHALETYVDVSTLHLASNEHYTQDISVSVLPFLLRYNTCKENFMQLGQHWPKGCSAKAVKGPPGSPIPRTPE
jgi:hypothetical protein